MLSSMKKLSVLVIGSVTFSIQFILFSSFCFLLFGLDPHDTSDRATNAKFYWCLGPVSGLKTLVIVTLPAIGRIRTDEPAQS